MRALYYMLMDDTIILATSRQRANEKIGVLREFCITLGMITNESKTQFMVINGEEDDRNPIIHDDLNITNCDMYTYLGARFPQDGRLTSSVKAQVATKICLVVKFEAFVRKNPDAPFAAKKKVFSAALVAAILYGSCNAHVLFMHQITFGSEKNHGHGSVSYGGWIALSPRARGDAQRRCIKKLTLERANDVDDLFMHVWRITQDAGTPAFKYAKALLDITDAERIDATRERVLSSERSKFVTYRTMMNPALTTHPMYTDPTVCEYKRRALTKFLLSSHNLAIERGRWSRTPRHERLCTDCDLNAIQDEEHVLSVCPRFQIIRTNHPSVNFHLPDFF
ncbi:hypothetical protein CAPTEDRAFT_207009 [Capitella teleta]|uniref:Reverse transcriptase domain-containing protein n=1 Tax=Capitella teleta TaxID=283909 RepID=R7US13_CAPTE|nr:hypothetical protein CAPTEDRAFT_207009 [Capitella teleta]|eukprot:ELU08933.1 hypothetical protein CAPTEDRAFT_207009 [Capitella teleta]